MSCRPLVVLLLALLPTPAPAAEAAPGAPAEGFAAWLEEVEILLSPEEREAFLSLDKDYRRERFIERFWQTRDPFPDTRRNEFRDLWEERVELARRRFRSLDQDRARVLLLAGPPSRVEAQPCPERMQPSEIWLYSGQEGRGAAFSLVFLAFDGYRIWSPDEGLGSLLSWTEPTGASRWDVRQRLRRFCPRGDRLLEALLGAVDWEGLVHLVEWLPRPSGEWVSAFLARSTELPERAGTFDARLSMSFPGRHQSRTVVQGLVMVPAPQAPRTTHRFVVDGEILRDGRLFEEFRYRFQLPAEEVTGDSIPLVVQRLLRPGAYTAVLKVHDLGSDRYFRVEREIRVPRVPVAPAGVAQAAAAAAGEAGALAPALAEANENLGEPACRLALRAPADGLLTGKVRIGAFASSDGVHRVAFLLDGKKVLTKSRPPFSVELDLGHAPRLHRVEAVGYDAGGRQIASDEIVLNAGPHRFTVRLREPRPGRRYRHGLRASAEVEVPRGERLDRLEFYLNETPLATLYQPPFVQPVLLPDGEEITYVRAVAYLADGNSTEDLVFINAPEHLDRIQVDFVELYASVVDRAGRPVEGLKVGDFRVLENEQEQRVARFERVRDQPIHAGVVIDTSTSMAEELREAERAALKFFQRVIRPRDRAAVFVFSDAPELRVPLTNSHEVLAGGLIDLAAEGETVLYDAIVESVYYFAGVKGKRALILLTDGQDSRSRHSFEEALDFARRSGIAIYAIGLDLAPRHFEIRSLLQKLARETGGDTFFIDRASQLDSIYARIEEELRSQYLLGYQSSQEDPTGFREVEVVLSDPRLRVKTIPGYYP